MGTDKLRLARTTSVEAEASRGGPPDTNGETILEHVTKTCGLAADEVWLLTAPESHGSGLDVRDPKGQLRGISDSVHTFADPEFYRGPLTALANAWSHAVETWVHRVFVAAGDLPGLHKEVLLTCKEQLDAASDDVDGVVILRSGTLQPLLGCYRPRVGQVFADAVHHGETRLLRTLATLNVVTVSSGDRGWSEWSTRPVHTPEDYEQWLRFYAQTTATETNES